jgi:hypothetical protein
MKIIGSRSLSSFLKHLLDYVWLIWVVCGALVAIACVLRIVDPSIKIASTGMTAVLSEPKGVSIIQSPTIARVTFLEALVKFETPSRKLILMESFFLVVSFVLAGGVLLNLRRVLASLREGQTFTRANARRLRAIAFFSLGGVLMNEGWQIANCLYLTATVRFTAGAPRWPFPEIYDFFFTLVLFVIAEAARIGAAMEEERALTV